MRESCARIVCVSLLGLALAGCSESTKKTFGLAANPPNAFEVGTQPPLSLPPELGQLPPPNPGEPRPQQENPAQDGENIMAPGNAVNPVATAPTPGAEALLDAAGPPPPGDIRAQVNENALLTSKSPGFVSNLMGSGPSPAPTVDASGEQRRLQENAALGQPVTQGATPQNDNKKQGFFGWLFGWI